MYNTWVCIKSKCVLKREFKKLCKIQKKTLDPRGLKSIGWLEDWKRDIQVQSIYHSHNLPKKETQFRGPSQTQKETVTVATQDETFDSLSRKRTQLSHLIILDTISHGSSPNWSKMVVSLLQVHRTHIDWISKLSSAL